MEHSERAKDDHSPARSQKAEPQDEDGDAESEEEKPLLGNIQRGDHNAGIHLKWSKWRRGLVVCVLWLAQVVMTSAYSLVGPFFPLEVHII